jgi:predicted transcriptional regulator
MAPRPIDVTESELSVLDVLWDRGPSTIRQLTEAIYRRGTTAEYATVQKLLERLEAKGCVARDRTGFAHVFAASVSRNELIGTALEKVAGRLCQGSLTPLLMHLIESTRLTPDERAALRRLVDEAELRPRAGRKPPR